MIQLSVVVTIISCALLTHTHTHIRPSCSRYDYKMLLFALDMWVQDSYVTNSHICAVSQVIYYLCRRQVRAPDKGKVCRTFPGRTKQSDRLNVREKYDRAIKQQRLCCKRSDLIFYVIIISCLSQWNQQSIWWKREIFGLTSQSQMDGWMSAAPSGYSYITVFLNPGPWGWSRKTSKTCRTVVNEDQGWETLIYYTPTSFMGTHTQLHPSSSFSTNLHSINTGSFFTSGHTAHIIRPGCFPPPVIIAGPPAVDKVRLQHRGDNIPRLALLLLSVRLIRHNYSQWTDGWSKVEQ